MVLCKRIYFQIRHLNSPFFHHIATKYKFQLTFISSYISSFYSYYFINYYLKMRKQKYTINKTKRQFVKDWFSSLRNSRHISWPACTKTNKEWYSLFKSMNPEYKHLIPDVKYFSLQINSLIDQGMFPSLTKKTVRHPKYKVLYCLSDIDYLVDINAEFEKYDASETGKHLLHVIITNIEYVNTHIHTYSSFVHFSCITTIFVYRRIIKTKKICTNREKKIQARS